MKNYNYKQEIKFSLLSFIALFTLWVMLSGYFEPFFLLCGFFSSAFTLFILRRMVNAENSLNHILNNSGLQFLNIICYIPWLVYQMIVSSIYVARKTLQIDYKPEPIVILIKCRKHNDESITLFANSVTITPGTLTIKVSTTQEETYSAIISLMNKELRDGVSQIEARVLDCF